MLWLMRFFSWVLVSHLLVLNWNLNRCFIKLVLIDWLSYFIICIFHRWIFVLWIIVLVLLMTLRREIMSSLLVRIMLFSCMPLTPWVGCGAHFFVLAMAVVCHGWLVVRWIPLLILLRLILPSWMAPLFYCLSLLLIMMSLTTRILLIFLSWKSIWIFIILDYHTVFNFCTVLVFSRSLV